MGAFKHYLIATVGLVAVSLVFLVSVSTTSAQSAVTIGGFQQPWAVAVGDLDGDGKLDDLVVANESADNVSVLLGDDSGGFGPGPGSPFSVGVGPRHVAIGDFDGDGDADLAVANFKGPFSGGIIEGVTVLLGTGSGSFGAGMFVDTFGAPDFVAIGDLGGPLAPNGDALQDLAVTGPGSGAALSTSLADGMGSFLPRSSILLDPPNPHCCPHWVGLENLNPSTDSNLDMVATLLQANEVAVLLGDGTGTFSAPTFVALGAGAKPWGATLKDFNGDGNLDIAVAVSGRNSVAVLLGDGTGAFGAGTDFPVGTTPISVSTGDYNQDGNLDIVAANSNSRGPGSVSVILGDGMGAFGPPNYFAVGTQPNFVVTGDFNGDTKPGLAVANLASNTVSILLNEILTAPEVGIDIKPGSFPNPINPRSNGIIRVAILTTEDFDATTIDPGSVRFGLGEATEKHGVGHVQDVDSDGDDDVVYHFQTQDSGIQCGDTTAILTGATFGGQPVRGSDSIVTRGCQ